MKKVFLIAGIALLTTAIFAQQLGIDNDDGWGRGRIIILILGLAFILVSYLISLLQDKLKDKLTELKRYISTFINRRLNYSYSSQIALVFFVTTIIIIIVYIWFTQPSAKDLRGNYNYYSELAIGFKAGRLYLADEPSPALLSLSNPYDYSLRKQHNVEDFPWDVSLYNNRFYTYWGPAPSLILTIFNSSQLSHIGDHYLTLAFACGLFLYSALIVAIFWHKSLPNIPVWMLGVSLLTIGLSAPVTIMLRDSRIYEAAIFGCQFFFIGGCYWAYSSISHNKLVLWKLAFASLHWAFALGTRITILPVILFSAAATTIYILRFFNTTTPKTFMPILMVLGLPLAMAGAGLSWYNWARFESIFEFGIKYQLTNVDYNTFQNSFSSRYITGNLFNYFVHPIKALPRFPYIARIEYTPSNDRLAGLIYISPYILLLFAPLIRVFSNFSVTPKKLGAQRSKDSSEDWLIIIFSGSAFISMIAILSFYFVTMRYIEDFMPSLLLLATIHLGREDRLLSQNNILRKVLVFIDIALAIITITASALIAMPKNGIAFIANILNSISKLLGLK